MTNLNDQLPDIKANEIPPVILFNSNTEFSSISDFVNFAVESFDYYEDEYSTLDTGDFTGFSYSKHVFEELKLSFKSAFESKIGPGLKDLRKEDPEGESYFGPSVETSVNLDLLYSYLNGDTYFIGFITQTGLVTMISFVYCEIVFEVFFHVEHYHPDAFFQIGRFRDTMYHLTRQIIMVEYEHPDYNPTYRIIDLGLESPSGSNDIAEVFFSTVELEGAQKFILPLILNNFGDVIDWDNVPEEYKNKRDTSKVELYSNYFSNVPVNLFPSFLGRPDYDRNPGYLISEFRMGGGSQMRHALINDGLAFISNEDKEKWLQVIRDYEIEHLEGASLVVSDPRWEKFIEVLNGR